MKSPRENESSQSSGCLSTSAGCLIAGFIFPVSMMISGWLAFALSMSCAHPSQCSKAEENAKAILALVIFVGGGFGIPLTVGGLVRSATHMNAVNPATREDGNEDY